MKNKNLTKFVTSLVYILLGLALIIWTSKVDTAICTILAVAAFVVGGFKFLAYFFTKVENRIENDTNGFAVGMSLIILGIFILLKGTMIIVLVPFILGLMITYKGLEGVQNVINMKKMGKGFSKGILILSAIVTGFGLLVMINPFATAKILYLMMGIGLFISGFSDLIADIVFSKSLRKAEASAPKAEISDEKTGL